MLWRRLARLRYTLWRRGVRACASVKRRPALDATLWDEPTTGIGLYARQLHGALGALGVDIALWGARLSGDEPRGQLGRSAWTLSALPKLLQERPPSLFHAVCNFNLPLAREPGVPFVLTVHDLIPLVLPHTVSVPYRWQFRLWLSRSLSVAKQVICISHTTKNDLLAHFEVDPSKIEVVGLGVDHVDRVPAPDAATNAWLDTLGLPEDFALYVGALDARKNVDVLLSAMERLFDAGTPKCLVLAGPVGFGAGRTQARIRSLQARGIDVRQLGYLHDTALYALMRRARLFTFPSHYEGFGLPPLEALRLGVATAIANAGALPEVCGSLATCLPADDVDAWASAIAKPPARPEGRPTFTWEQSAKAVAALYGRLT